METPISIEIKSDLLSKIPPHKLSQIVEATLCQIQKAVASSWLNDVETEATSEIASAILTSISADSECKHDAQSKQPHNLQANQEKLRKFLEDCTHFEIYISPEKELYLYRKFLFGIDDRTQSFRTAPILGHKPRQTRQFPPSTY